MVTANEYSCRLTSAPPGAPGGGLARAILDQPEAGFTLREQARRLDMSRAFNPALQTLEQWLGENAKRIPLH